jgi:hypothetical protein
MLISLLIYKNIIFTGYQKYNSYVVYYKEILGFSLLEDRYYLRN